MDFNNKNLQMQKDNSKELNLTILMKISIITFPIQSSHKTCQSERKAQEIPWHRILKSQKSFQFPKKAELNQSQQRFHL